MARVSLEEKTPIASQPNFLSLEIRPVRQVPSTPSYRVVFSSSLVQSDRCMSLSRDVVVVAKGSKFISCRSS